MKPVVALATLAAVAAVAAPFAITIAFADGTSTFSVADRLAAENEKKLAKSKPREFALGEPNAAVKAELVGVRTDEDGALAVVLKVTNGDSAGGAVWAPLRLVLKDASGAEVGRNDAPGTDPLLNHLASIGPGESYLYVLDQLTATGDVATVEATVGGGANVALPAGIPKIAITKLAVDRSDPFGVAFTGTVTNTGDVEQPELPVMVVSQQGGHVLAAGTSVVDRLAPGASTDFSGYFIGDPKKGELVGAAPATSARDVPGAADDPAIVKKLGIQQ